MAKEQDYFSFKTHTRYYNNYKMKIPFVREKVLRNGIGVKKDVKIKHVHSAAYILPNG